MVAVYDYTWNQGADLTISLVYKSGPAGSEVPVDLTLYSFRMDIVAPNGKILTVLNDKEIEDTEIGTPGDQGDTSYEVTLSDEGGITIELGRELTLPGGALFNLINANPSSLDFNYDAFLRDTTNKQRKILSGVITVEKSHTKWL